MDAGIGISTHIDWGASSVDRVESEDCEDGIENNLGNLSISKVRKRFGMECAITKTKGRDSGWNAQLRKPREEINEQLRKPKEEIRDGMRNYENQRKRFGMECAITKTKGRDSGWNAQLRKPKEEIRDGMRNYENQKAHDPRE